MCSCREFEIENESLVAVNVFFIRNADDVDTKSNEDFITWKHAEVVQIYTWYWDYSCWTNCFSSFKE